MPAVVNAAGLPMQSLVSPRVNAELGIRRTWPCSQEAYAFIVYITLPFILVVSKFGRNNS